MLILNITSRHAFSYIYLLHLLIILIVMDFVLSILSRLTLEFKFEIWEFAGELRMSREMAEERIGKGIKYK